MSLSMSMGGAERGETQNLKQAPGSVQTAQSLTWGSNPGTMRSWPEPKSDTQPTEPPRRPSHWSFYPKSTKIKCHKNEQVLHGFIFSHDCTYLALCHCKLRSRVSLWFEMSIALTSFWIPHSVTRWLNPYPPIAARHSFCGWRDKGNHIFEQLLDLPMAKRSVPTVSPAPCPPRQWQEEILD